MQNMPWVTEVVILKTGLLQEHWRFLCTARHLLLCTCKQWGRIWQGLIKQTEMLWQVTRAQIDRCVILILTCDGTVSAKCTMRESKSLWLLTNSWIQPRYTQVGKPSLKPRELEHSNPPSPCQVEGGYHDMKNLYALATIIQAFQWLKHCGNQENSCQGVLGRKSAIATRAGPSPLSGVCWNKSCISSDARQKTLSLPAVCHAALLHPTRCFLPWLLSDAQHSASCFHNSSGTDGWHSCSASPHGLLKKAINQSRHSIQAGNWPIRVAQDAYVQADDFTNWLSIYTNTGTPQEKLTGCIQSIFFSQAIHTTM